MARPLTIRFWLPLLLNWLCFFADRWKFPRGFFHCINNRLCCTWAWLSLNACTDEYNWHQDDCLFKLIACNCIWMITLCTIFPHSVCLHVFFPSDRRMGWGPVDIGTIAIGVRLKRNEQLQTRTLYKNCCSVVLLLSIDMYLYLCFCPSRFRSRINRFLLI